MTPRATAVFAGKILAIAILMLVLYALGGGQLMNAPATPEPAQRQSADGGTQTGVPQATARAMRPLTPEEQQLAGKMLVVVCLLNALALAFIALRSRWSGWKLVLALFVFFYGNTWVMTQIETLVFLPSISHQMLARLMLMGFIIAAPCSIATAALFGKLRSIAPEQPSAAMRVTKLPLRLAICALTYVALYFIFGYYVAWKSPDVRAYYNGTDPGSFAAQIQHIWQTGPWFLFLQFGRGLLFTLIALPIVRMTKGSWWVAGILTAVGFSVLGTSQLLLPNPIMPEPVRMVHLLEVSTSSFIFGWIVARLLVPTAPVAKLIALEHRA